MSLSEMAALQRVKISIFRLMKGVQNQFENDYLINFGAHLFASYRSRPGQ